MLRVLVLVLLLANGAYFAWSEGMLRAYGYGPAPTSEPQRLEQQIKPDNLQILSAQEFKKVEAQAKADQAPKECLQSPGLDEAQAAAVRASLDGTWSSEEWRIDSRTEPARWIVYMGKYTVPELLDKKRSEVAGRGLKIETLVNPTLEPGFSLGHFDTKAAAEEELARLSERGVRTARVLQERAEATVQFLKVPTATEAMKARLSELRSVWGGKALRSCS